MGKQQRHTPEQIILKLRHADTMAAEGKTAEEMGREVRDAETARTQ